MWEDKKLKRRINNGAFGSTEILVIGFAVFCFVCSILFYVLVTLPTESDLKKNIALRDQLQRELDSESQKYRNFTSTENQVSSLIKSVEDFESRFLPVADIGKHSIYQRLNYLMSIYNLVNTSGPEYSPLEIKMQQSQTDERGRARFQNIFPGIYITMTVEGPYQNLRRFIRDIEAGDQFLIITSIELQPSQTDTGESKQTTESSYNQSNQTFTNQPFSRPSEINQTSRAFTSQQKQPFEQKLDKPKGKLIGETVSLKIELVSYFRRGVQMLK